MIQSLIDAAENRRLSDRVVRLGIDSLLQVRRLSGQRSKQPLGDFVSELKASPIALETKKANSQHYEVPASFFELMLGPRLKYSCCNFSNEKDSLEDAEIASLSMVAERAGIKDGMRVLDLGCGWGSLSLFLLEKFPKLQVVAVSNSKAQAKLIRARALEAGVNYRLEVITSDINDFQPKGEFDRVCSIEAFEHMRNYHELLRNISSWLKADGKLFVHIFCHKNRPYLFSDKGAANWMGRHFFSGGMMPSQDLLREFDDHLRVEEFLKVSGLDYSKTLEEWLLNRWRMFLMACSELFNFKNGEEWFVGHYLLSPNA